MNFFKKSREIEIITPSKGKLDVQEFARRHAKPGTYVKMNVLSSLHESEWNLVSIRFTTNESRDQISENFRQEFGEKKPTVRRRLMFCH